MISAFLRETETNVLPYDNLIYVPLRNTILHYVTLYQKAEYIEHIYKNVLVYLNKHGSLKDVTIPYLKLKSKNPTEFSSKGISALNHLALSELVSA